MDRELARVWRPDGKRGLKHVRVILPFSEIMSELETSSVFLEEMSGMGAKELVEYFLTSWERAIDEPTGKVDCDNPDEWRMRNIRLMALDILMANLEKLPPGQTDRVQKHREWELGFRHVWNLLSSEIIIMVNTIAKNPCDILPEVKFYGWIGNDLVLELPGCYLGQ